MSFIDHRCVCGRAALFHDPWSQHQARIPSDAESELIPTFTSGPDAMGATPIGVEPVVLTVPGERITTWGRTPSAATCTCEPCRTLYEDLVSSGEYQRPEVAA